MKEKEGGALKREELGEGRAGDERGWRGAQVLAGAGPMGSPDFGQGCLS